MHRVKFLAILAGALIDTVMTYFVSMSMGMTVVFCSALTGSIHDVAQMEADFQSPALLAFGFVLGGSCTVFGGFVAGRIAKTDRILNGFIMGFVSLTFAVIRNHKTMFTNDKLFWYEVICIPATIVMGALGAYFADLVFGRDPQSPPARQEKV